MFKQVMVLGTATAVGFGAGMLWERGFSIGPFRKPSLVEKENSSKSETAAQPGVDSQVAERVDIEKLKMEKRILLQQIVRLIKEREALKLEKDDCAAREATAIREKEEAMRAKEDAERATANAIRVAAEAIQAEEEARQAQDVALSAVEEANSITDRAIAARDLAIGARDNAIRARRDAVKKRKRVQSEVKKVIEQYKQHTQKTLIELARGKLAAAFARNQALSRAEFLRLALVEKVTELAYVRRTMAAVAHQNSLRSITMNPPQ